MPEYSTVKRSHRIHRVVALSIAVAAVAMSMLGGAVSASATEEAFCSEYLAGGSGSGTARCHDPNLRLITRVNVRTINRSACASALNSNLVEVGGWVCTPAEGAGEASNGNYDGTKWLYGLIANNSASAQYLWGKEWYNP